jgi:hypothetical protein
MLPSLKASMTAMQSVSITKSEIELLIATCRPFLQAIASATEAL